MGAPAATLFFSQSSSVGLLPTQVSSCCLNTCIRLLERPRPRGGTPGPHKRTKQWPTPAHWKMHGAQWTGEAGPVGTEGWHQELDWATRNGTTGLMALLGHHHSVWLLHESRWMAVSSQKRPRAAEGQKHPGSRRQEGHQVAGHVLARAWPSTGDKG